MCNKVLKKTERKKKVKSEKAKKVLTFFIKQFWLINAGIKSSDMAKKARKWVIKLS